jgi:shikimate kinase
MLSTIIYWPPWIGKSTVWAILAQQTWRTHIDTDRVFVSKYGDITNFIDINWKPLFRQKEWEILKRYLHTWDIVTLWWWTLTLKENQELADTTQNVITLMTDMATIVARITNDRENHRPLAQSPEAIEDLYQERYNHYTSQRVVLNIGPLESAQAVADNIQRLMLQPKLLIPCKP